jgi:PhzF family phenazine biosynthesis protein
VNVADVEVIRRAAFTDDPAGGNPAGIVLDASKLDDATMQAIAADVGYSETAFLTRRTDGGFDVRYFAPDAEVDFCGHATIATGVELAQRLGHGTFVLHTNAGVVPVDVVTDAVGRSTATLTSIEPRLAELSDADRAALLAALRWPSLDVDEAYPARLMFAGNWHPVLAACSRARLRDLDYDAAALRALMIDRDWTTIHLIWREDESTFHVRAPAPNLGVVEDPATGAAAAAFGHYLRETGLITPPATVTLVQGEDLGRRSVLSVAIADADPRIRVSGTAVPIV